MLSTESFSEKHRTYKIMNPPNPKFASVINHKKSLNEMHLDMNTLLYLFTIIATNILFIKKGLYIIRHIIYKL